MSPAAPSATSRWIDPLTQGALNENLIAVTPTVEITGDVFGDANDVFVGGHAVHGYHASKPNTTN